jgi:MFS family permease
MTDSPRPTRPQVFAVTITPFAAAVGYSTIAAPNWLRQEGVSIAVIGTIVTFAGLPHVAKVLWAPLIDVIASRKAWFLWNTLATAAILVALAFIGRPADHLVLFGVLSTLCNVAGTTACAAADGLMAATTRYEDKGKAGGYRMAGNVGGTGLLGAIAIELAGVTSIRTASLLLAVLVMISGAAVLVIHEPGRVRAAGGMVGEGLRRLKATGLDLWHTLVSREGWTGLVICAVPVGAGALTNLFSALGVDYGASDSVVAWVNGVLGGIVGAVGALVGGYIADRMNRRLAYALSGALTSLSALAMFFGPLTQTTYAWGTLAYNFANGIAFATLAAFVLDMVGDSVAAATKYTAFIAVSNLPNNYATFLDGWASEFRGLGARGSILADVVLTVAGIGVLLAMLAVTRRTRPAAPREVGSA